MRAEAAVARKDEMAVGKPVQQDLEHLPHQLGRRFVAGACFLVLGGAAIQHDQEGQGPRPPGKRKRDQDRQHDPFVAVTKSGVGVG